uniref:hypothetical protein n=1 Tax=Gordonia sp. B7-2 TaxID=3420932 RepID=UPI003D8C6463
MAAMTPWAWVPYVISASAVLVSLASVTYTKRAADHREFDRWHRDALLVAISEFAGLSWHRQNVLSAAYESRIRSPHAHRSDPFDTEETGGPHPVHSVDQMAVVVERIRLLSPTMAETAERITDAHRRAVEAGDYFPEPNDIVGHIGALMVDSRELAALHADLSTEFDRATQSVERRRWPRRGRQGAGQVWDLDRLPG